MKVNEQNQGQEQWQLIPDVKFTGLFTERNNPAVCQLNRDEIIICGGYKHNTTMADVFYYNMKSNAIEKVAFNLENQKMDGKPAISFADNQTWAMLSENKVVFIQSKEDDHHIMTKYAVIKDETGAK